MLDYVTFDVKYYILSQIFYKKIGWMSSNGFEVTVSLVQYTPTISRGFLLRIHYWFHKKTLVIIRVQQFKFSLNLVHKSLA